MSTIGCAIDDDAFPGDGGSPGRDEVAREVGEFLILGDAAEPDVALDSCLVLLFRDEARLPISSPVAKRVFPSHEVIFFGQMV